MLFISCSSDDAATRLLESSIAGAGAGAASSGAAVSATSGSSASAGSICFICETGGVRTRWGPHKKGFKIEGFGLLQFGIFE